jgi:hypothetical protein
MNLFPNRNASPCKSGAAELPRHSRDADGGVGMTNGSSVIPPSASLYSEPKTIASKPSCPLISPKRSFLIGRAKRPFICKQHPVTDQWESGSGRRRLTVPSGEPRHQCFGGICEHRGVRRSCFHPVRAERRRSVGDQMGRLSDPFAAASQNIALYRRLGRM